MELRAGLAWSPEKRVYLVGGSTYHGDQPYSVLLCEDRHEARWSSDFEIRLDLKSGSARAFDVRPTESEPIALEIVGRRLSHNNIALSSNGHDLSRFIGVLGGEAAGRIARAHIAVIGSGGIGAQVACMLAQSGGQTLSLLDDDILELSNLHRMPSGFSEGDIGKSKAQVLGELLCRLSGSSPEVHLTKFGSIESKLALRGCDLLVVASDNIASRREAALFAASYLIPCIGVGTGFQESGSALEVGIAIPGDGCLNCLMHLPKTSGSFEFGVGRIGSLASLNSVAAGLAVGLIEDYSRGQIVRSVTQRFVWDNGLIQIPTGPQSFYCDCQNSMGMGDFSLRRV
jgi:molybdopterin/thiamine biosynthesis adenylyltransferase